MNPSINRFLPRSFSSQVRRVAARYEKPGLTFHNVGNEHYNVLNVHSIIDPAPHELQLYQDRTGGDNVDSVFAYDHSFRIRVNMTRFYTKTGDEGYTGLLGKGRVQKYDRRIETIGAIDEANATLGLARAFCLAPKTASILLAVQKDLYHIMAEIAATPENAAEFQTISGENVTWLEGQIDSITKEVEIPDEFIIPGDSKAGAVIDLARTVVRRAERQVAYLLHKKMIANRQIMRYVNRLSSLCFALELLENQAAGSRHVTLAKE